MIWLSITNEQHSPLIGLSCLLMRNWN